MIVPMLRTGPNGWVCGAPRPGLFVHHAAGEDYWRDVATAFYRGETMGLERVESSLSTRVYRGFVAECGRECYFKRYLNRSWVDPFKNVFRGSRARRALANAAMCSALGFRLPRPRCLVERRRAGYVTFSALITEAIDDAAILPRWLMERDFGLMDNPSRKHEFLRALALELSAWHRAGLHHGDLRRGNILGRRADDGYVFYWLDNDRTRRYARLPTRQRVHNLMQINLGRLDIKSTDRMRFWKAYLETAELPPAEEKKIVRRVARKTYQRLKRIGRV